MCLRPEVRDARLAAVWLACALTVGCDAYDPARLEHDEPLPVQGEGGVASDRPDASASRKDAGDDASTSIITGQPDCTGDDGVASCSRSHALTACVSAVCLLVQCEAPWVDCDGDPDNGCETTLDSLDNCGLCGASCALPHAETTCESGKCVFERCQVAFGDCDGSAGNGCETSLRSIDNCGRCGVTCDAPDHAAPGCASGTCEVGQCLGPFGDCDRKARNGCEVALSSLVNCGGCGSACAPEHGKGDCTSGTCAIASCTGDRVDCDGLFDDGCEATLDTAEHCGACGASCDLTPQATRVMCAVDSAAACVVDHRCDEDDEDCVAGAVTNGCKAGFADCDSRGDNGCETPLETLTNCGSCAQRCENANAISACEGGNCQFVECLPGFALCSGDSCMSLANDEDHCGDCDTSCSGGKPNCFGGKCTGESCATGSADCNGLAADGCEASIASPDSCGVCDLHCGPYAHASAGCQNGRCTLDQCDDGYRDCDGAIDNGCEVDIHTLGACGACDASCAIAFATESCDDGNCELVKCDDGRADCDGDIANGCEINTNLPGDCGACGNNCRTKPNVIGGSCDDGSCSIVCKANYGDCDGKSATGCEANLASARHCGSCDNDCTKLPNVQSASCDGTLCTELACKPGFGDCDGVTSNGCERALDTNDDCGACNTPCAPAHAGGDCSSGTCLPTECDSGYDDCNQKPDDGCEASLASPAHCGTCANACAGNSTCENGECACTESADCGGGHLECCNQRCVDTYSVCSLWPCPIPDTSRPITDCGGCDVFCPLSLPGAVFCCAGLDD